MKNIFSLFLTLIFLTDCKTVQKTQDSNSEIKLLQQFMTGSFNSAQQAAEDKTYYDITLHMYPIWPNRKGHWLYVEQAVTANQLKPYRQRVYELKRLEGGSYASYVYLLKNPENAIQKWKEPQYFEGLTANDIKLKEGCEVVLKKQNNGSFSGKTGAKTCPSSLRGASYATSIVTVFRDEIISWDQGFDEDGKQVWGATEGGYVFEKE